MPSNTKTKIIYTINDYSLEIFDGIKKKKIKIDDLYNIIKKKGNIKVLNIQDITKQTLKKLVSFINKLDILDEILYITDNKYSHLKNIRYVVNLDRDLDNMIPNDLFLEKIKIKYTNKILDKLLEKYYDYDSIKLISKLKEDLDFYENNINFEIMKKISEFYVKRITM